MQRCRASRDVLEEALVVDGDVEHARALRRALEGVGAGNVHVSSDMDSLHRLATPPTLVVAEATLVAERDLPRMLVQHFPRPAMIFAMSDRAERSVIANLIWHGFDGYLEKPVAIADLLHLLRAHDDPRAHCARLGRALVGRLGLKEAQDSLRESMNAEALVRTSGNRRAAARLLDVDRAYVRRLARAAEDQATLAQLEAANRSTSPAPAMRQPAPAAESSRR